jgi:ubiquinone biosynthesis protein COQ9
MFPSQCRRLLQNSIAIRGVTGRSMSRSLSSTTTTTPLEPEKSTKMQDQKRILAEAALTHVPHHGWTQDAITAAVLEHPQMSISMSGLLTPTELVNWLMDDWNEQIKEKKQESGGMITPFDAIQWRLQQVIPLVKSGKWHQGIAIGLSTPMTTQNQLHEFVEIIAPPNSSTMYKTGLGGVFISTELFMLADASEDYQETWDFLRLRMQELNEGKFVNFLDSNSISMAATGSIAFSLLEGVASLLMPTTRSSTKAGTKAGDYEPSQR